MAVKTISKCASCGYPITASYVGETASCPMCGTLNEAISGVEIPTPLFAGGIGFLIGLLLGPVIIASTAEGRAWLEKTARAKIRG